MRHVAFAYDPEQVGIRFCCDRWDDLVSETFSISMRAKWQPKKDLADTCFDIKVVPKCVPAPVEEQFVAMIDGREAR